MEVTLKLEEDLRLKVVMKAIRCSKVGDVDGLLSKISATAGGLDFQLIDTDMVAGRRHLEFAALNALQAFRGGYNFSKSLAVEALLFASAQRQIGKAFKLVGLRPETQNIAVIIFTERRAEAERLLKSIRSLTHGIMDDSVFDIQSEKKRRELMTLFKVTDRELQAVRSGGRIEDALTDILVERVALLATQR